MIELIPIGFLEGFEFYLQRIRTSIPRPRMIILLYIPTPESERLANDLAQAIKFYENIPLEKRVVEDNLFRVYFLITETIYTEFLEKSESIYFNLGTQPGSHIILGLYNSLIKAPSFSKAYEIVENPRGTFNIQYIPAPLSMKKKSEQILAFMAKNPSQKFTIEDLIAKIEVSKNYLLKILEKLERKGQIFSSSSRYNRKSYGIM